MFKIFQFVTSEFAIYGSHRFLGFSTPFHFQVRSQAVIRFRC